MYLHCTLSHCHHPLSPPALVYTPTDNFCRAIFGGIALVKGHPTNKLNSHMHTIACCIIHCNHRYIVYGINCLLVLLTPESKVLCLYSGKDTPEVRTPLYKGHCRWSNLHTHTYKITHELRTPLCKGQNFIPQWCPA